MKIKRIPGRIKIWQQRLSTYVSLYSFLMVFYLYIQNSPLDIGIYGWTLIIIISSVTLVFIDVKFIYPHANAYAFSKNPEFQDLKKKVKEVRDDIKEIKEIIKSNN